MPHQSEVLTYLMLLAKHETYVDTAQYPFYKILLQDRTMATRKLVNFLMYSHLYNRIDKCTISPYTNPHMVVRRSLPLAFFRTYMFQLSWTRCFSPPGNFLATAIVYCHGSSELT